MRVFFLPPALPALMATGSVLGGALAVAVSSCGGRATAPIKPAAGGSAATEAGGPDAAPKGGPPDADASVVDATPDVADAGVHPPAVAPGHLQLWLTADRGVTCVDGEVTSWADQSGKGHDATRGSHKGPQCPAELHDLARVNLPYFSAPGTMAPFSEETLDVNLSFLANTEFTIFAVERRWADWTPASGKNAMLVGTDTPNASGTCPGAGYQINLGYVYYDGYPALGFESACYRPYTGTRGRAPDASAIPPSPVAIDMVRLWQDAGASPTVWQNGVKINVGGASGGPGSGFVGGSIGRAFGTTGDNRYQGDIAEVMIFDAALNDGERVEMEAYFSAHWQL
jgi:hypothetical protein